MAEGRTTSASSSRSSSAAGAAAVSGVQRRRGRAAAEQPRAAARTDMPARALRLVHTAATHARALVVGGRAAGGGGGSGRCAGRTCPRARAEAPSVSTQRTAGGALDAPSLRRAAGGRGAP
eukprot:SAG11_NODE_8654_length_990_cov_7.900112_1_plen_121_part_00